MHAKEALNNLFFIIPARPLEVPDGGKAEIQLLHEPGTGYLRRNVHFMNL